MTSDDEAILLVVVAPTTTRIPRSKPCAPPREDVVTGSNFILLRLLESSRCDDIFSFLLLWCEVAVLHGLCCRYTVICKLHKQEGRLMRWAVSRFSMAVCEKREGVKRKE